MNTPFYRLASILFFFSGATGLAYQVIWFRRFSHIWGNSSLAMGATVASFLFGLGLGAYVFGKVADRTHRPLLWYGVFEIGIGLLALVVPIEIHALLAMGAPFVGFLETSPLLLAFFRVVLTFVVLGPPCMLMGGTLPLLVRHFTADTGKGVSALRGATGWLYAINTLGAAVGCYAAGFHLLSASGILNLTFAIVGLNVVIGAVAVWFGRGSLPQLDNTTESLSSGASNGVTTTPRPGPGSVVLHGAAVMTGAAALALEMVWARQLSLVLGGSTYAFTAVLLIVLVGIGVGSLWWSRQPETRGKSQNTALFLLLGIIVTTLIGQCLIPVLTVSVGALQTMRSAPATNAAVCVSASAVLELVPAIGMGLLFPLLVQWTRSQRPGSAVGSIYAANTAGSIVGSVLAPLVLIPWVGTAGTVTVALIFYGLALLLLAPPSRTWQQSTILFTACTVVIVSAILSSQRADPRLTDRGMFMYGDNQNAESEIIHFAEGRSVNVLVLEEDGLRTLRVNGKVDASSAGDMSMQLGLAYFPIFVRPDPDTALVIGFGSGTTVGALLLFEPIAVTCCEIEPEVFRASKHFSAVNHRPYDSPRLSMIFDDGRSYLQRTKRTFDLIASEPSNPWIAGVSNLFTREFYETVKARLSPGGLFAQWIQTYSLSPTDYAMVVRTVLAVFPEALLVRISDSDTILLASSQPLDRLGDAAARAQVRVDANPEVGADLDEYFESRDVRRLLLTHLFLDREGLDRLLDLDGGTTLNTDSNLRLEFDAPLRLFGDADYEEIGESIQYATSGEWFTRLATVIGAGKEQAAAFHTLATILDSTATIDHLQDVIVQGLKLDPENASLLADDLITQIEMEDKEFAEAFTRLAQHSLTEASRVGEAFFENRRYAHATMVFNYLTVAEPHSVTSWLNLERALRKIGKDDEAEKAAEKARSLDPLHNLTPKPSAN